MQEGTSRKLAVILHADVVSSTSLVQTNETLAHERIRDAFRRFSEAVSAGSGIAHEIRGDALVAEFPSASDAVEAALKFQADNSTFLKGLADDVKPVVRIGIAMGEVVVADDTVTGEAVVLAQRLEQLAEPGGICIQGTAQGTIPRRLPYVYESLGERELKGFGDPVRAFVVKRALQDLQTEPDTAAQTGATTLNSAERPSIAVLPFESNREPEFADGLTNDLITDLEKFGRFTVAAPHSTMVYKGQAATVRQVARELSADYVLEGRVQWSGNRARISAQLSDGTSGEQVWAQRYQHEVEDIFDLQDELVSVVSASIAHKLDTLEANRTTKHASTIQSARDLYARGREIFFARTRESSLTAAQLLAEAIELDQHLGRAYGFLGWVHAHDYRYGWSSDPKRSLDFALELALKGFSLDPTDYESHWRLGVAHLHRKDFEKALLEYDKARRLNPNHAGFLSEMSGALVSVGRTEDAVAQMQHAMKLNPNYPNHFIAHLGWALYAAERYDDSLSVLREMNNPPAVFLPIVIATNVRLGLLSEAKFTARQLLDQEPGFKPQSTHFGPYKDRGREERFIADLRAADIPG